MLDMVSSVCLTHADANAPPPRRRRLRSAKIFLRRLLSFVVLWTIVLTALFSSNRLVSDYVFLVIMVFLAVTGLAEFYGLAAKRDLVCFERWGILGGVLLMVGTFLNLTGQLGTSGSPARVNDFETSFLILFVLGLCLRQFFSRSNTAGIAGDFHDVVRPDVRALAAELHPEDQFLPRAWRAITTCFTLC